MKTHIKNEILAILDKMQIQICNEQLTNDLELSKDLSFDSLRIVILLTEIELRFNIEFEESDLKLDKLKNIGNLLELIEETMVKQRKTI